MCGEGAQPASASSEGSFLSSDSSDFCLLAAALALATGSTSCSSPLLCFAFFSSRTRPRLSSSRSSAPSSFAPLLDVCVARLLLRSSLLLLLIPASIDQLSTRQTSCSAFALLLSPLSSRSPTFTAAKWSSEFCYGELGMRSSLGVL